MAKMLVRVNRDGIIVGDPVSTQTITSTNLKEIIDFLRKNSTCGGFTIQYAINPQTNEVIEIFKKGKVCQKDIKDLVEAGFVEFHYSFAFAGKRFLMDNGQIIEAKLLDLVKMKGILPYKGCFGY